MICEEGCEVKVVGDMFSRLHGYNGARINPGYAVNIV
jgi:hypothetical protein